jgi:ribosomal protein L21
MPTEKKWVVDDTGLHAIPEFVSAPADKTAVHIEDTPTDNTQSSDDSEVEFIEGKWLPGEDGFQFNKKCKVQVKAKFLKETKRRKVTVSTFVKHKDVTEDLGQQVDVSLNDDGIAEGEAMLFYGDKYSDALQKNPDLKCYYKFKATHGTAKDELESEELEMPQESTNNYGGYELQKGDKDSKKKWGGEVHEEDGEYVKELQEDLVNLGYWVSNADTTNGMVCDGHFGLKTNGAVITFQREHDLQEDGKATSETATKIKECTQNENYERPSHTAGEYGEFIQLPPNDNYGRYFSSYDDNGVLLDIWGTTETIRMIRKTGEKWIADGKNKFMVGDISLYNRGVFKPHASHKNGKGVDTDSNEYCSINKSTFKKEESLELAKLFMKNGAKRILFNCKYVTDNCDEVYAWPKHENHFHVDTKTILTEEKENNQCDKCAIYDDCNYENKHSKD